MVTTADKALKCTACHFKGKANLLNWEELGYDGDPVKNGGLFK